MTAFLRKMIHHDQIEAASSSAITTCTGRLAPSISSNKFN
jgi:hypothetical protein